MQKKPKEVCFDQKEVPPDESAVKRVLGETYAAYQELLKSTDKFPREWKFYGKKYGWQLKVMQKTKALLYLVPRENSFLVGFAVREYERDALLNSKLPEKAKEELRTAKKYLEGYPLRFSVRSRTGLKPVRLVVDALTSMRS